MIKTDPCLKPDWDEDNINHTAVHGIRPEQVEEVYYSEGPFPALAIKKKKTEENLLNIDIAYGVQMPLDSVLKSLWPPTPSMVCGDA